VPGVQVDLILGTVQPKRTVPSASLPSRSSMSRVCIFRFVISSPATLSAQASRN
jgi:hypothetical protein